MAENSRRAWSLLTAFHKTTKLAVRHQQIPTLLVDRLDAVLSAASADGLPFIRISDAEGQERGAYVDIDALNLLLRLQSIIENPDELARLLGSDDSDYVDADLERMLANHAE